MRRLCALPVVLLAAALPFAQLLVAQDKPRPPRRVALLVGPKTYLHDFTALPHLDDDVNALAAELKKGGFDEVVVLTDLPEGKNPATKENILAHLDRLLSGGGDKAKAIRKDDVVLLTLSGHGLEVFLDGKTKDTFFAPTDGKKKEPKTLLNVGEVLDKIGGCGCRTLMLADMCRDIYDPNKGKGLDTDNLKLPRNAAVLFGCESTQQSFVNTEVKHSLFTYAVLEVMKDANRRGESLLWSELVSGVEKRFGSAEFKKLMGDDKQQSPVPRTQDLKATTLLATAGVGKDRKGGEEVEFEIADGVKMTFCWIPPGKATLGSPKEEKDRQDNEREHEYISKGFWMAKYTVTQAEWTGVMNTTPFFFHAKGVGKDDVKGLDTGRLPAEQVSWDDAQDFLKAVNKRAGVAKAFGSAGKFKLPHEDEWEYACRGGKGNTTAYYWGDTATSKEANISNEFKRPTAVGSYAKAAPHPWGLCDMSGNVFQWCDNEYSSDSDSRVFRGGSWGYFPSRCRAACRIRSAPDNRGLNVGFRACFALD